MSNSVNTVLLLGRLGADPERRTTASGRTVTEFRVATNRRWVDRAGSRQEETEWHRVVTWGRTAELAAEYLHRGRQVFVEGRLKTDRWTDRDGRDRYTTKVIALRVVFLGGRGDETARRLEEGAESAPGPGDRLFEAPPEAEAVVGLRDAPF